MLKTLSGPLCALVFALPVQAQTVPASLTLTTVATGRSNAVAVRHARDGSGRLFVVRQGGRIDIIGADGTVDASFLNIGSGGDTPPLGFTAGGERGLLGLAFHPMYAVNGRFFVSYTDAGGDTAITEYRVSANDPQRADPTTARVILRVWQPSSNHNGGDIHFGPDGYLYIGMGDGGGSNDTLCQAAQALAPEQLVNTGAGQSCAIASGDGFLQASGVNAPRGNPASRALLGKMLRIDIDVEQPRAPVHPGATLCGADTLDGVARYDIPPDNPFAGSQGGAGACDETYHYGLRNPWRFSFDRATDDLIIGDVGQGAWEEVDLVPPGGGRNFGWRVCEGRHQRGSTSALCALAGRTDPIMTYGRSVGFSISGGFRYRGPYAALDGVLFFADYGGALFAEIEGGSGWNPVVTPFRTGQGDIVGFGEGEEGHLYLAALNGSVRRIELPGGVPDAIHASAHAYISADAGTIGLLDGGDIATFSASVLNSGDGTVDQLAVEIAIDGVTATAMQCTPTTLAPNRGAQCEGVLRNISQAEFEAGAPIGADITATAQDEGGNPVASSSRVSLAMAPRRAALTVSKTVQIAPDAGGDGVADVGDRLTYSVSATNAGNVTLHALELLDQPDVGAATALDCAPQVLAPQHTANCVAYALDVAQEHVDRQQPIINEVIATALDPDNAPVEAADTVEVAVTLAEPALQVTKQGELSPDANDDGLADAGDVAHYSVAVLNTGNVTLQELQVQDQLGAQAATPLACAPATLAPQQSASCTGYSATVAQADIDAGIAWVNIARAQARTTVDKTPVQHEDQWTIAVATASPSLAVDLQAELLDEDGDALADAGEVIRYTLRARNEGNVTLQQVGVDVALLGGMQSCTPASLPPQMQADCGVHAYSVGEDDLSGVEIVARATASGLAPNGTVPTLSPEASAGTPVDRGPFVFRDGFEE